MTNYVNFKLSIKDVEKNPGPTQYNTGHHEVIIEGLRAKRAYIEFWPIFIFCRIEVIFGRLTCFDMKSIVP